MKRSISLWQFIGFAVISLGGTFLHFLYDWLGQSIFIAPFSAVNESTWEHMKLLFWPMLFFAIVQRYFFPDLPSFWCIKLRGMILGLALIPILFYTYNGAIGKSPDWLNIAIFFISAAIAIFYETRLFYAKKKPCSSGEIAVAIFCVIALLFVFFTFQPPDFEIFRDPLTKMSGI